MNLFSIYFEALDRPEFSLLEHVQDILVLETEPLELSWNGKNLEFDETTDEFWNLMYKRDFSGLQVNCDDASERYALAFNTIQAVLSKYFFNEVYSPNLRIGYTLIGMSFVDITYMYEESIVKKNRFSLREILKGMQTVPTDGTLFDLIMAPGFFSFQHPHRLMIYWLLQSDRPGDCPFIEQINFYDRIHTPQFFDAAYGHEEKAEIVRNIYGYECEFYSSIYQRYSDGKILHEMTPYFAFSAYKYNKWRQNDPNVDFHKKCRERYFESADQNFAETMAPIVERWVAKNFHETRDVFRHPNDATFYPAFQNLDAIINRMLELRLDARLTHLGARGSIIRKNGLYYS